MIPNDKSTVSLLISTIQNETGKTLKEVMEQGWPLIGDLYDSCLNFSETSSTEADKASVAFLSPVVNQIAATTSKSELFYLAGKLTKGGYPYFTKLEVSTDKINTRLNSLYVTQTGLSLPDPQYYLDREQFDSVSKAFHAYVEELFSLIGYEPRQAAAQASSVIAFEQKLAPLFVPTTMLEDPMETYNRVGVAQAADKYPLHFAQLMNGTGMLEDLVTRNASVIVFTPKFFDRVEELVTGDSVTLDTLKAVLTYQYVNAQVDYLSESFVQASFTFFRQTLRGVKNRTPRGKVCIQSVKEAFPGLVGKYFALLRFDKASEQLANQLMTQIQASLQKDLTHLDWMDESTRQTALEKMGNMTRLIGYSKTYEHLPFKLYGNALYAENIRLIMEHDFHQSMAEMDGPVDRNKWIASGAEINAYYEPATNRAFFPAGFLQSPYFDRTQHPARNFGGIGESIGHELTHCFDDFGRLYDSGGNGRDWWSENTATEYAKWASCFVSQYSKYAVMSSEGSGKVLGYVDGNNTLVENIADNIGFVSAFRAYQIYVAEETQKMSNDNKSKLTIISANQTGADLPADVAEKLFFIALAQGFCSTQRDTSVIRDLATNSISPDQWRVNGAASNSHDFARVFSCPAGSSMNPTTKCVLL